ncbi:nardilysin-like [Oscarella lobularis]|uniref:nardilysin-like n=1 Tax=Oscarella lobularis TaxID=121494 RepID=UPI0033144D65
MEEPVKSPNDKRIYRTVTLSNGLRALVVCDPSKTEEETRESDEDQDAEQDDMSTEQTPDRDTKLAAAALCVGVGSFSDPDDIPGLAHFIEHMVFLGSEKYPEPNGFDAFLKKHGGCSNASTDCERTVFHFEVRSSYLREALDRFAQLFISPLLTRDSMDKEIDAVDSEFQMSLQSDSARKLQVLSSRTILAHPFGKFLWGNAKSLKETPKDKGIDVHERGKEFFSRAYSSHLMTLVVVAGSGVNVDSVETWIREIFVAIPRVDCSPSDFKSSGLPFNDDRIHRLIKVRPVKDIHAVEIMWQLPSMFDSYRCKPMNYVGWLLGHEGPGSILSFLKRRGWALEIIAGNGGEGYEYNSCFSLFSCSIILTEDGLHRLFECCDVVFQYLAMLRRIGPQIRIFRELQTIEDNSFRFQEEGEPAKYACDVVENMQLYPPRDYLTGDDLMFDYDHKMISTVQDSLTPTSACLILMSTHCDANELDVEEPWFQTSYAVQEVPAEWNERWRLDLESSDELHVPAPNAFIATDFTICNSDEGSSLYPVLVNEIPGCKLWFKGDAKFKTPRTFICANFVSPLPNRSPESAVLLDLMLCVLEYNLKEIAYAADVAELSYSYSSHEHGAMLQLSGFSQKLPLLLETIQDYMAQLTVDPAAFEVIKKQLYKNYHNYLLKPEKLSKDVRLQHIQQIKWGMSDKLAVVDSLTSPQLLRFYEDFRAEFFAEFLVQGNITRNGAIELVSKFLTALQVSPVLPSRLPFLRTRCLRLPKGSSVCRVANWNKDDSNSVVTCYYQIGLGAIRTVTLTQLLVYLMEEPCFDILRTKEQLGYSVYPTCRCTHGVLGFSVTVVTQVEKFSVEHITKRIESFLNEFCTTLRQMDQDDFDESVDAFIELKLHEDLSLEEEVEINWPEVIEQAYVFDRRQKEAKILESFTRVDVADWLKTHITAGQARRSLTIQVSGHSSADAKSAMSETGDDGVVVVDDVLQFKNSLSAFPLWKIDQ